MKSFSKKEIDEFRSYFKNKCFQEVDVSLGNRNFSYFVIPQSQEPNLLNFVIRATGKLEDGAVFGISDNVEEKYRPYAVAHEYIEFKEIGIDSNNKCIRALEEELKLVPEEIKKGYVEMRKDFFKNLVDYCLKYPEHYNSEDINQFKKNYQRLEELVK